MWWYLLWATRTSSSFMSAYASQHTKLSHARCVMVDGPSWQKMRRIEIKNYQSKACPKEQSQAWCISSHSSSERIKQTGKWTQWKAGHSGNTQKSAAFLYTTQQPPWKETAKTWPQEVPQRLVCWKPGCQPMTFGKWLSLMGCHLLNC